MQQLAVDATTLLSQLAYYFPWYVCLVLVPMAVRVFIERLMGIRPELLEGRITPMLPVAMSYESAFRAVAVTVLYYPLFEELLFRGLPLFFFGVLGLAVGSTVWVVMHPAWQLQYLSTLPLWKRLAFTATSSSYYATNAVFYGMMWLNGAGMAAIMYHVVHNGWLTLVDIISEVELPAPWKKYRYIRRHPIGEKTPPTLRLSRKPVRRGGVEEELPLQTLQFVVRKPRRTLADEVEEAKNLMFVKRKAKNEE